MKTKKRMKINEKVETKVESGGILQENQEIIKRN